MSEIVPRDTKCRTCMDHRRDLVDARFMLNGALATGNLRRMSMAVTAMTDEVDGWRVHCRVVHRPEARMAELD